MHSTLCWTKCSVRFNRSSNTVERVKNVESLLKACWIKFTWQLHHPLSVYPHFVGRLVFIHALYCSFSLNMHCRIITSASALKLGVISFFCFRFAGWAIFTTLLLPCNNRVQIKKDLTKLEIWPQVSCYSKTNRSFRVNCDKQKTAFQFDYVGNFLHPFSLIFQFGNNITHL